MARNLTIGGRTFHYPEEGDQVWAGEATDWAEAITNATLQKSGGLFTLTADLDFGNSYGQLAKYFSSRTTTHAVAGVVRLANAETISWRNALNTADLALSVDATNNLVFNGSTLLAAATLAASRALVSSAGGVVTVSAVTATELGYVAGVTSALQTQLTTNATNITTNATNIATNTTNLTAHTGATAAHGATGAVVGTTNAQVLTNKDIDGGTAANTRRITIPSDTKANLDALTRKAGTVVFGTDTLKAYADNGTALVPLQRAEVTISEVIVTSSSQSHGSTNTKIRRFSTTEKSTGTAVTYADSATLGGSFTINQAGIYAIHYQDAKTAAQAYQGISKNSSQLTTDINVITASDRLAWAVGASGFAVVVSATASLAVNDVIRAHTDGTPDGRGANSGARFSIIRIGD